MAAHRKVLDVTPVKVTLDMSKFDSKSKDAIKKDIYLIEAALAADGILVTRDDAFYRALKTTPKGQKLSNRIRWLHPIRDGAKVLAQL